MVRGVPPAGLSWARPVRLQPASITGNETSIDVELAVSAGVHMKIQTLRFVSLMPLVLVAALATAQESATLTGTVSDPTGAALAGAQISVSNAEHGIQRSTVSNNDGQWTAA